MNAVQLLSSTQRRKSMYLVGQTFLYYVFDKFRENKNLAAKNVDNNFHSTQND